MSTTRRSSLPSSSELSIQSVIRFLTRHGWISNKASDQDQLVFKFNNSKNEDIFIYLPRSEEFASWKNRIEDALYIIRAVHKYNIDEAIFKILYGSVDSQEKRVLRKSGHNLSVPFSVAAEIINNFRQMAATAASAEEFPAPYLDRQLPSSQDFLSMCNFPHTFRGSFGFAMEVDIPPHTQTTLLTDNGKFPFERRVMKRIQNGLKLTQSSLDKGDAEHLVNNHQSAFNANMCSAMSSFLKKTRSNEIISTFSWCDDWKDESLDEDEYFLNPNAIAILDDAAKILKSKRNTVHVFVNATIEHLYSDVHPGRIKLNSFLNPSRTIELMDEYEPMKFRKIKISLDPNHHAEACDAYKEGYVVQVEGELARRGNILYMDSYSNFKITSTKREDIVKAIQNRKKQQ